MKTAWTVARGVPMTIDKDFYESCVSLTNRESIENTLAILYYGRVVFPFIAAVYVGLTSEDFLAYFLMPFLVGIFSVLNHLFQDDFVVIFFRYLFALFQTITLRLGFIATPIIISVYHKSPLFAVAFVLSFTAMWVFYRIVDAMYRAHIKSRYMCGHASPLQRASDLTEDDIISLWDRKCLTKLQAFQHYHLPFSDYITYYFESILEKRPVELCGTLLNRLEKENDKEPWIQREYRPVVVSHLPEKKEETLPAQTTTIVSDSLNSTNFAQIAAEPEPSPAPTKTTVEDQIAAEEARYRELAAEIRKIPAQKVKEMHAEGAITDEQFMQIAKRYNKLRAEMRDIRERIEVLKQIENTPEP